MTTPRPGRALGAALLGALLAAPAAFAAEPAATAAIPKPPTTRMQVVRDTLHGKVIADPYRWLEDQQAPETRSWLDQQNAYFRKVMERAPGRAALHDRLDSLMRAGEVDVPVERAKRQFFLARGVTQDLHVLTVRALNGRETVLLDPAKLSKDRSVSLRLMDVSLDGTIVAAGLRKGGEDEVEVTFVDVATRARRKETLPRGRYHSLQIAAGNRDVYYSRFTADGPRVYRHRFGTPPAKDALVFGDGLDREKIARVQLSDDGRWMLISIVHGSAGTQVQLYAKDLVKAGPIVPLMTDVKAKFEGRFGGGSTLYVLTNWKTPKGRILAADLARPDEPWKEILKEGQHAIDSWTPAGGNLLVNYIVNAVAQLYLIAPDGRPLGAVPIGDAGAVYGLDGRFSDTHAYLYFGSYTVPKRVLRVAATTNAVTTWWAPQVPFRGADYETKQVWFASKDGTRIPMFVSHRRGLVLDGKAPAYLTGYGGFGVNTSPWFSARAAVWMENGGVWAEAVLRGGAEFGEEWHQAGMLAKKQNVFDDFFAAAEALARQRYTSRERLAIGGGSNGGLLVGAALTQRPDLCRAVVCEYPLLDMVRYHRFMVARFWVPEYGSSEDEAQFGNLYGYSPYHRVQVGTNYPATLFVTGDSDTRVAPLHARKMTALVQSATASDYPVLLHYDTTAGHSTGSAVSHEIENETDVLQFVCWQLGVTPRKGPPPPLPPEREARDTQP